MASKRFNTISRTKEVGPVDTFLCRARKWGNVEVLQSSGCPPCTFDYHLCIWVCVEMMIWIFKDVRDERKPAIDWLNELAGDKITNVTKRMELRQIGDSACAPKFQMVSRPNGWAKAVHQTTAHSDRTDRRLMQIKFWMQFKKYSSSQTFSFRLRKTYSQRCGEEL